MKVTIDTNVMLVSPSSKSIYYPIYLNLIKGNLTLCVSNDILLEYQEVFTIKMGEVIADKYIKLIDSLPSLVIAKPYYNWNLISSDVDDNKFVDCAIASNSDYIITNDRHFDILKTVDFPVINVISAADFINTFLK